MLDGIQQQLYLHNLVSRKFHRNMLTMLYDASGLTDAASAASPLWPS